MQSLMGETTAVAHGGDPQDRAAFPRPRCIALQPRGDPQDRAASPRPRCIAAIVFNNPFILLIPLKLLIPIDTTA